MHYDGNITPVFPDDDWNLINQIIQIVWKSYYSYSLDDFKFI